MLQLTDTISWDEKLDFEQQSNETKNFVSNVIENYGRTSEQEAIPMSDLKRKTKVDYTLDNGVVITQTVKYKNDKKNEGWAEIKSIKYIING